MGASGDPAAPAGGAPSRSARERFLAGSPVFRANYLANSPIYLANSPIAAGGLGKRLSKMKRARVDGLTR
jgi:hypothetical protein